jgi:hypothetical protein
MQTILSYTVAISRRARKTEAKQRNNQKEKKLIGDREEDVIARDESKVTKPHVSRLP